MNTDWSTTTTTLGPATKSSCDNLFPIRATRTTSVDTVTIVDARSFESRVCFHVDLVLGQCCSLALAPGTICPSLHSDAPPSTRPCVFPLPRSGTRDHRSTVHAPGTIVRACLHSDAPPSTCPCVVPFPRSGTRDHRPSPPAFRPSALAPCPLSPTAIFWTPGITRSPKRVTNRQIEG